MNERSIVRNGRRWLVTGDRAEYWDRVGRGEWEPHTYGVFDRFLDPDHSYIDVGAYVGATVLYGAHLARHCYALEPNPVAFSILQQNVDLNPSLKNRIMLSRNCLSSTCGPVTLGNTTSLDGGDSMSSMLFTGAPVIWEVPGVTLKRFILDNRIDDCSFIKIDIEGGEFDVVPAIADYLAERRPTVFLSVHPGFVSRPLEAVSALDGVLASYRHVYTPDLREVTPAVVRDTALLESLSYELVLSDLAFP